MTHADDPRLLCDRLFQAFGWPDAGAAGASLDTRPTRDPTLQARLHRPPDLMLELRRRGTRLDRHQAFEHWQHHTAHPKYVVLCDHDELLVHDFDHQLDPLERFALRDLDDHREALSFLGPEPAPPRFSNDRVAATRAAAVRASALFHAWIDRGVERERARRFVLRCVLDRFAARLGGPDLPLTLTAPVDLQGDEPALLAAAAAEPWSRVQPAILGELLQASMDPLHRHALGAHFTREADIQRIVLPTLVRPWREQIDRAGTPAELQALHAALAGFRVLDPACGSGNFLDLAYRELVRLEIRLRLRLRDEFRAAPSTATSVSLRQLFGIDRDPVAVELTRLTLRLAQTLAHDELRDALGLPGTPSPPDDLDANIVQADALFCDWPACHAIVGNPPFQSKNKLQRELGAAYVRRLRERYPDVSGLADYCVYWFRRAHDALPPGGRAGLVGTNTIRQNDSRASGLDHIVRDGTITEAVATEVWSGDASVHVSIVNWIKTPDAPGPKHLSWQDGDARASPWKSLVVDRIHAALSPRIDLTSASALATHEYSRTCHQGQTHGHEGFLLPAREALALLAREPASREVLHPFLNGDDLLRRKDGAPSRHVIDFGELDLPGARRHRSLLARVEASVLPTRQRAADHEDARNHELLRDHPHAPVNRHHAGFLARWWHLSWRRTDMLGAVARLSRYIVCARVTRRPVFEFVDAAVRPSDSLVVFSFADDYAFGVLQSSLHGAWFVERCSTLTRRFRYTSSTVYDAFPWPQAPTRAHVLRVAEAALALRRTRAALMHAQGLSRRELYRLLDAPGDSPLRAAHDALDAAVRAAYGLPAGADDLQFLLDLNTALAAREGRGDPIAGPGLPAGFDPAELVTSDRVSPASATT